MLSAKFHLWNSVALPPNGREQKNTCRTEPYMYRLVRRFLLHSGSKMSLFFFHVRDGSTTFDGDGVEFPDVEAARREAIVACGELLREVPAAIWNGDSVRLWVTDQPDGQGNTLYSLNISPGAR